MNKRLGNIFKGDKVIWMVFFFLCMISVVEVFSASSNLTYKSNNFIMPIVKHSGTIIFGVFVAVLTVNIPCRYFKLMTPFLLLVSFVTLLWVLMAGENINGAQRVIEIPGFTFQPSEIAKGTMILAEAQILSAMQGERGADKKAFKYILCLALPLAFLIMLENLSTAVLLCTVVVIMMVIGRVPMVQVGKLLGVVVVVGVAFLSFVMAVGHDEREADPRLAKVDTVQAAAAAPAEAGQEEEEESAVEKLFHRADTWKSRIDKFLDDTYIPPQDYDLDKEPTQEQVAEIERKVNEIIESGLDVTAEYMPVSEASKIADLRKLPENVSDTLRIVRIGDYDACACIGAHVDNTSEIGRFKIISHSYENGKWRVRFKLEQQ